MSCLKQQGSCFHLVDLRETDLSSTIALLLLVGKAPGPTRRPEKRVSYCLVALKMFIRAFVYLSCKNTPYSYVHMYLKSWFIGSLKC